MTVLDRTKNKLDSSAPSKALRFEFAKLKLATDAMETSGEKSTTSRAVKILARTPNALEHWYWGSIVHDFAGMLSKEKIALDYCHDDDDMIGYADKFTVDESGLWLTGRIESTSADDAAETLLKRFDKGIPFEGSIYFEPLLLEWIPEGTTTEVNGQQITGEAVIVRKWALRGCSVCPHGYDYGTETELSAKRDSDVVQLNWKDTMSTTNPADGAKAKAELQAELKQFTDRFGAIDGVNYFTAGTSIGDATAQHLTKVTAIHSESIAKLTADHDATVTKLKADHDASTTKLSADLAAANAAREAAEQKLTAAQNRLGEHSPIKTGNGTEGKSEKKEVSSFAEARELAAKKTA